TGGTYSGVQPDGSKVAVKRLKRSSFKRKKEFYSEIGRVARLRHPNLVVVMGCCYDHGDRYIVYEFVANGPLDKWLHHIPRGGRSLDWAMRMKIATTLAQGIASLSLHRCSLYAFLTISTARPLATLANLQDANYIWGGDI
ncbi:C-type lectin receptor-like tyrosine-protein kinase, partial [Trifolium medium]|nr:C-type lectin receptor-like tyrosine-protein kinase [Trifolium medium]